MASIAKRGNSYRIMVSLGYNERQANSQNDHIQAAGKGVSPVKSNKLARAFAYEFEKKCQVILNLNENMRFAELSEWYFEQIAPNKLKEITLYSTKKLIDLYILPAIGHLKLKDITAARLDMLFNQLRESGGIWQGYSLIDVNSIPRGTQKATARKAGLNYSTVKSAGLGGQISKESAEKIAVAMEMKLNKLFYVASEKGQMEPSTIARIRTATSSIFTTVLKKDIITKNPVKNATTPKIGQKKLFLDESQCKQLFTFTLHGR